MKVTTVGELHAHSLYYQGARNAFLFMQERLLPYLKGDDLIYMKAEFDLALKDMDSLQRFLGCEDVGFRNHQRKGKKLVSAEAYFM